MTGLPASLAARIEPEPMSGCWIWTGARGGNGQRYGRIRMGRRTAPAHRVVYELLVGPLPAGTEPDHRCNFGLCVNPFGHVRPKTRAENMARTRHAVCLRGHNRTENRRGRLICRPCREAARSTPEYRAYMRAYLRDYMRQRRAAQRMGAREG